MLYETIVLLASLLLLVYMLLLCYCCCWRLRYCWCTFCYCVTAIATFLLLHAFIVLAAYSPPPSIKAYFVVNHDFANVVPEI